MKTIKIQITVLFIILLGGSMDLKAQQDYMTSQYMFNGLFLNPGYAGSHDYGNVSLLYRQQWVRFDGAPRTGFLAFETPVKDRNIGLGAILSNDHIGVTDVTKLDLNYSYHLQTGLGKLSFGLSGGGAFYKANISELEVWEEEDQVFQKNTQTDFVPNFGFGIYYYMDRGYAGVSVPRVLNYGTDGILNIPSENIYHQVMRHYYFTAGYVFEVSDAIMLKPSTLLKYAPNAPLQVDINLNMLIDNVVWIGGSYRTGDAIVAMLQIEATTRFRLGYAYDITLSDINNYSDGSHEIMLSYDLGEETVKMKTPRFF